MNVIMKEIKSLFNNPRLLLQYIILHFFLISVGCAAVLYCKKELIAEHSYAQSRQIEELTRWYRQPGYVPDFNTDGFELLPVIKEKREEIIPKN